ncbi:MAG TPA: DUF393 domain-containing protein [Actinomycetota bacterium]|nr:DUF393 domain-containing protein [Actinomycetota bacterium]
MARPLLVLYDGDCGFCRWSADRLRAWDRRGRLTFGRIQDAGESLGPVSPTDRLVTAHAVEPDGRIWSGGAAMTRIAAEIPAGAPLAWVGRRWPGLAEAAYRAIVDRRERLGAWLGADACAVDPMAGRR